MNNNSAFHLEEARTTMTVVLVMCGATLVLGSVYFWLTHHKTVFIVGGTAACMLLAHVLIHVLKVIFKTYVEFLVFLFVVVAAFQLVTGLNLALPIDF